MTLNNILKFQSLTGIYEPFAIQQLPDVEHAEGGYPALINRQQRTIIASDDGSMAGGRLARFLLLDPEQLQITPLPGVEILQ